MRTPQHIEDAIERLEDSGSFGGPAAVAALREVIEQDPAYARLVLAGHANKLLASRRRARTPDPALATLFPGLPVILYVQPGVGVDPMACTRWGLEKARNMLYARGSNQVQGATEAVRREREAFQQLCDLVMPLMARDPRMTVGEALDQLRASVAA